jgi:transcriptional regulator with XRE-family HTH domain
MKGYQLTLFHPTETTVGLEAFLACALTGLDNDQMSLMRQLSNLITQICAKHSISVHEPSVHTYPPSHPHISDVDTFRINRERVLASDLLIHFTHFPSTEAGQALDFAYSALLPMIIISRSDESVSRMITGIPSFKVHIRYQDPLELRDLLEDCLDKIKPILRERKLAFSNSSTNFVGKRIRTLRKQQGLSRKEVAANVDYLTEETLTQIEECTDQQSNPSLFQLRQIAVLLKTTVADLVEPDMGARVVSFLNEWLEGRQAARYPHISEKDSRKIMRRMLLRVIDSLEKD